MGFAGKRWEFADRNTGFAGSSLGNSWLIFPLFPNSRRSEKYFAGGRFPLASLHVFLQSLGAEEKEEENKSKKIRGARKAGGSAREIELGRNSKVILRQRSNKEGKKEGEKVKDRNGETMDKRKVTVRKNKNKRNEERKNEKERKKEKMRKKERKKK